MTIFRQLFEPTTSTYTYLLADSQTKEAVLIDPVLETVDRDTNLLKELGLELKLILDTHVHADHITGAGELKKRFSKAKTGIAKNANVSCADLNLKDGDKLEIGSVKIEVLETPGHTDSCLSYVVGDKVFTGDVLLIRGTGRTDFQQGSNDKMYHSVTKKLFSLPDTTKVYPGHDYKGFLESTIEEEKKYNPRLGGNKSFSEFEAIMKELKLAHPKKIHEALPANLTCGTVTKRVFHPQIVDGRPEVTVEDIYAHLGKVKLVDVRRPDEFTGELGHIPGSILKTMGPELEHYLKTLDKNEEIVFVCRSGGRSGQVTEYALQNGFQACINMQGGMLRWNELKYKVER